MEEALMTHEGEEGHPIGCTCIECHNGRQADRIGDEIANLRNQLAVSGITEAQKARLEDRIRSLERDQDRLVNNTTY